VDTERPGFIRGGGYDPAASPAVGIGPHDHGTPATGRVIALLHRGVEGVHVDVEDPPLFA
jgi:hypothetical protein